MPDPVFEDTTQGVFPILFPPGESRKDAFPDASRLKLCLNTIFHITRVPRRKWVLGSSKYSMGG